MVLEIGHQPLPWGDQLRRICQQYSTNRDYQALDLIVELVRRGLFVEEGRTETVPWPFQQSIDDYIESFHGRASFSRERMTPAQAAAFDAAVRAAVTPYAQSSVELPIVVSIVWGRPLSGEQGRGDSDERATSGG